MIKICPSNKSQIFIKYSCGWFIKLVKILTVRQGQTLLAKECPNFEYMKNLRSSPSEHFLVIMVCQKRQKCKNSEKPGFWGNCGYFSKMVMSIFMIFWYKTTLTINKRMAKNSIQIFSPFLRNHQICKIWNFSKT